MTELQLSRMLSAVMEAVEEVGYARMTVSQVIGRAGVSRKTFYDFFADSEDCFLAAFEQALSQARPRAGKAYEHEADWREGIRAALARLLMSSKKSPLWPGCASSRLWRLASASWSAARSYRRSGRRR